MQEKKIKLIKNYIAFVIDRENVIVTYYDTMKPYVKLKFMFTTKSKLIFTFRVFKLFFYCK